MAVAFRIDEHLPEMTIVAQNFAADSDNKMHSDDIAPRYGFKGGLVPGVGTFGYMTRPIAEALGREWLENGSMTAKFIKPIYDQDEIRIQARVASLDPLRIVLSVLNTSGTLCAVGEASMPAGTADVDLAAYPLTPTPASQAKFSATVEALPEGTNLGSLCFPLDLDEVAAGFVSELDDPLPLYRGAEAVCHPALVAVKANELLIESVALGPWIHTESNVLYSGIAKQGELLCLRAKVRSSYVRRGHDTVILEMVLTGENDRILAHLTHSTLVRPKPIDT